MDDSLTGVFPFSMLSAEDRERVRPHVLVQSYRAGQTIFVEGDSPGYFHTVKRGWVKVSKIAPNGREVILGIFGPGDPVGAVAVYDTRPYPASASAIEDAEMILIPRGEFFSLLDRHPTLARGLLRSLTARLISLTNRLAEIGSYRIEPRFARLFLRFTREVGVPGEASIRIPIHLSRQELADLAGTTVETSIRIMSRWDKSRIVETRDDGFVVLRTDRLEDLAGRP